MSDSTFPLLFTLPPSSRHELLLLPSSPSSPPPLKSLNQLLTSAISSSPNCEEFMSKYKNDEGQQITELKVHWSAEGRDMKIWPETTIVTEQNWEALYRLLERGVGRDVLEVKVGKGE